jgi:tetratricopeptide (TPR) repeat protein
MAFLNLARIHYQFKQFGAALFYYDRVTRESEGWLDALFEGSWAAFRINRFEKSLGNLLTLHSPFFSDYYYNPESYILKAVVYYENCRYQESYDFANAFIQEYEPIEKKIREIAAKVQDPEKFYRLMEEVEKKKSDDVSHAIRGVFSLVLSDVRFRKIKQSMDAMKAEEKKVEDFPKFWRETGLTKGLADNIKKTRAGLVKRAGKIAQRTMDREAADIKDLIGQAYRIRLETNTKRKEVEEARLQGINIGAQLRPYDFSAGVPDDSYYWSFNGEFWRDELGTYEYSLTTGCKPGQ